MIFKRLHKWILSLAILASVLSFDGFIKSNDNFVRNTTELVVTKKISFNYSTYFLKTSNSNYNTFSVFRSKSLIRNYNLNDRISFETLKIKSLDYLNDLHFKMISHTYSQNEIIEFS